MKPTPAVIEQILADPNFHGNLRARAAASAAGTHPEDAEQNEAAAKITEQQTTVEAAVDNSFAKLSASITLGSLLQSYVATYFPNL